MNYGNLVEKATSKVMKTKGKGPRNLSTPSMKKCPNCGRMAGPSHSC